MKPREKCSRPDIGGVTGQSHSTHNEQLKIFERVGGVIDQVQMQSAIDLQTDLVHLPMVSLHKTTDKDFSVTAESDREVWKYFLTEQLFDTRRLNLKHFHLFEWFPVAPGKFHTEQAKKARQEADGMLERDLMGKYLFDPYGKSRMVEGGIGTVRLRPRLIAGEPHYFMTASSSGVCHEGFPVLIPRRFYGPIIQRILREGAAPVTLSGEMRYISNDTLSFFGHTRDIPLLYLHVDSMKEHTNPRIKITKYEVSIAVSFEGEFKGQQGVYITYATFNPSNRSSLAKTCKWIETFYVKSRYNGVIITDFDELYPKFPTAVFGLPDLMAGRLDSSRVSKFLQKYHFPESGQNFFHSYKVINTQGGAYIEGNVNVERGDFTGRDKFVNRP
jgi:hypothetical protein